MVLASTLVASKCLNVTSAVSISHQIVPVVSHAHQPSSRHLNCFDGLGTAGMANGASLVIGLAFVVVASLLAYFFSPKGDNQTVWRSSLILSFASCYIMWAITFMAQWHPLIKPSNSSLRPQFAP